MVPCPSDSGLSLTVDRIRRGAGYEATAGAGSVAYPDHFDVNPDDEGREQSLSYTCVFYTLKLSFTSSGFSGNSRKT
jgi:hypothetical protein